MSTDPSDYKFSDDGRTLYCVWCDTPVHVTQPDDTLEGHLEQCAIHDADCPEKDNPDR